MTATVSELRPKLQEAIKALKLRADAGLLDEVRKFSDIVKTLANEGYDPLTGNVFTARQLAVEESPPPRKWAARLVDEYGDTKCGLLPLGEVGLLAGPGGGGKSSIALGLSVAISAGLPALGCIDIPEAGGVFYVSSEDDRQEMGRRVKAYMARYDSRDPSTIDKIVSGADRLRIACRPKGASWAMIDEDGNPTPFIDALMKAFLESGPLRLIVLDTLNRLGNDEIEKSPTASRAFVEKLEQLTTLPGNPTVLLLHHSRKQDKPKGRKGGDDEPEELNADDIRGTSGLVGGVRFALVFSPRDHGGRLALAKSNYGGKGGVDLNRHGGVFWSAT